MLITSQYFVSYYLLYYCNDVAISVDMVNVYNDDILRLCHWFYFAICTVWQNKTLLDVRFAVCGQVEAFAARHIRHDVKANWIMIALHDSLLKYY